MSDVRLAVMATALLVACSPAAQAPVATTALAADGAKATYLTDSFNGSGLVAIDPLTLHDAATRPLLPLERTAANNTFTVAARDGTAIAVMTYAYGNPAEPRGLDISVYDPRTGTVRARFHPEVPVIVDGLSADGSRLFARPWPPRDLSAERLVLDASTGKLIEREPAISWRGEPAAHARDDEGRRLYVAVVPADPQATAPRSVDLGAWDLRSGKELWRVPLPAVTAGRWMTGRTLDGRPIYASFSPGLALSHDGRMLAIVTTAGCCVPSGKLWLIDAHSGTVLSERGYQGGTSLLDRLFRGSIAEAKSWDESMTVSAAFFPDGEVLHAWAHGIRIDERGEPIHQYQGMVAVRLSDAAVLGTDIKMERGWYDNQVSWVRPSADGRWLYLFLKRTGEFADPKGYVLRRVDPAALRVLTERRFADYRQAFVLARR
jgi:hypothetical protein